MNSIKERTKETCSLEQSIFSLELHLPVHTSTMIPFLILLGQSGQLQKLICHGHLISSSPRLQREAPVWTLPAVGGDLPSAQHVALSGPRTGSRARFARKVMNVCSLGQVGAREQRFWRFPFSRAQGWELHTETSTPGIWKWLPSKRTTSLEHREPLAVHMTMAVVSLHPISSEPLVTR